MHELTRQARSPATFYLPEPNYTNSQCDRVWRVADPRGWGELGPKKCTVMVKVPPPPGPWGWGRTKLSGEEEWRAGQTAGSKAVKDAQ